MTTTEQTAATASVDAHRLVAELVRDVGLPTPRRTLVREHHDRATDTTTVSLALTLATLDELRAWAVHVDTTQLEPTGPHRVGPDSTLDLAGRLRGVDVVLSVPVAHDHPADLGRADARALLDGPPTADHDTAGWRAAIDAAATAAAAHTPEGP